MVQQVGFVQLSRALLLRALHALLLCALLSRAATLWLHACTCSLANTALLVVQAHSLS